MREMCVCNEHEFDFQYTDTDIACPKCGRRYIVFMDANDDGSFYYDLILAEEEAIA